MKKITIYFFYELLILITGLMSIALSTTIMSDILRTIYMKLKQKENYFRLVTLKTVHLNDKEFRSNYFAGTFDKQYVFAGFHNFVIFRQRIIFFSLQSAYKIGHDNTNF